ncbi:hypothetical protein LCGC14_2145460 [marine sediment metagenome]|uniref:HNH nuclease domain-containing protein n=1 Tax=marine sediment metagenome TaxID=412755 RepID=A0A0F9EJF4_9ZZZZ
MSDSEPLSIEAQLVLMMDNFVSNEKQAEQDKRDRKKYHQEQVLSLITSEQDTEKRRELASKIYLANRNIGATDLAIHMGAPPGKPTTKYIKPTLFNGHCKYCGDNSPIPVSSRGDIKYDKYGMFVELTYRRHECDKCQNERAEGYRESSKRDQEDNARLMEELRTMPYREYLETDHWENTRRRALNRANYKCEMCNGKGVLHVHHKTYARRGDEWMADLIVLCKNCHAKFHDKLETEEVVS